MERCSEGFLGEINNFSRGISEGTSEQLSDVCFFKKNPWKIFLKKIKGVSKRFWQTIPEGLS